MARENADVQAELSELKEDFTKLRTDVSDLVKAIVDAGVDSGGDAVKQVRDQLGRAQDYGKQSRRQVEHRIEEHPWTSVGVAFSAGMLIGFLLRR